MYMPSIFGESIFDDWMNFHFPEVEKSGAGNYLTGSMKTDIHETDDAYEFEIDLPGYKKDQIQVKLQDGTLTIATQKEEEKKEEKDGKMLRRERYRGSMSRSFYLGDSVELEDIHAKFEDGILKLTVDKVERKAVEEQKYVAIEG